MIVEVTSRIEAMSKRATRADGIRTVEDLRARCWVDDDTGCWHWRQATDANGRPSAWLPGLNRRTSLGVIACYLKTGAGPKRGQAWHCTCATSGCANPDHRVCGTRSSQMLALKLSRTPLQRARMSVAKMNLDLLSLESRDEIAGSTDLLRVIAERYGISMSQAHKVRNHRQPRADSGASVFNWRP